ncbi:MAG: proline dehydrogenase family protein [Candidatus Schekmanbacteria bacterium]|nr:proline dehydrogenase family protein [Candidatus Schekmanbacteria bacterium]
MNGSALFSRLLVRLLPLLPKRLVRLAADRYIAGETLDDALSMVRTLGLEGIAATLDILGEDVAAPAAAEAAATAYSLALERIAANELDCNVSVKPSQLGLKIDRELCCRNFRAIVSRARELGNFVRIDMEDHTLTSPTIALYRELRRDFDNVGLVLQAYMRRSIADVDALAPLVPNFRLCKGIYDEPRALAYKMPAVINDNFTWLLQKMFDGGSYVGIATHDEALVWSALREIERRKLTPDRYEFQMLLGVDPELRSIIVGAGHRLRVYVPFGAHWHAYSLRRLRENPRMASYVARDVTGRFVQRLRARPELQQHGQ